MNEKLSSQVSPLRWVGDVASGHLEMVDQKLLPALEEWSGYSDAQAVARAITEMVVRGAPAIGIAAAYGVVLGFREDYGRQRFPELIERLSQTRPTAVNLFWALERMQRVFRLHEGLDDQLLLARLFEEANAILAEDRAANEAMSFLGADLFRDMNKKVTLLTHCNTGGLATAAFGTALGVVRALHAREELAHLYIDETRPYLQGARLTTWECQKDGIPGTLICDSMASHMIREHGVDAVIVGTDRVAANGDVANKIGTYQLAISCAYHKIPFYVAAPISTLDLRTPTGAEIEIEERSANEVTHIGNILLAPQGFPAAHPAFDVTPASLVTAIITERGVARPPYGQSLAALAAPAVS